jgi:type VII secretion-associated serine protease mycosin
VTHAGRSGLAVVAAALLILVAVPTNPASADAIRDRQWHLTFLHASEAHRHSQGEGVVVAVVDTGVDATHPDLAGAVIPGTAIVGTGDGRTDINGHGTAVAGLIAARGRGGDGVLGLAPRATVVPVYVGGGLINPGADTGIDWAVDHGAKVVCVALGGNGSDNRMERAIAKALAADAVVVAGVGNKPTALRVQAPARYTGVVAAAGVDRTGNHLALSVTGPEVTLAAPATGIVTTGLAGGYVEGEGTSDATAIIAGVAALVRAKYPELKAPEVIHRMTATAIDKGKPGRDEEYGYGIVDPVAALTADVPPLPSASGVSGSHSGDASAPRDAAPALGWIVAGVLLAAAAVRAAIALRRYRR